MAIPGKGGRHLVLLSALALVACTHAAASRPSRPSCTGLTAAIRERATAAETFTQAGATAALSRAKLTPMPLPERQVGSVAPVDDAGDERFRPAGTVVEEDGKPYVAGPLISVPNGQVGQPYFEFVKDEAGDIYQLERVVDVQSTETAVLCGCGPVGSGAAPHVEQILYELPPGARFRGVVKIAYPVRLYQFSYSGTDERGKMCQPPP
jgi:hypothetical protein